MPSETEAASSEPEAAGATEREEIERRGTERVAPEVHKSRLEYATAVAREFFSVLREFSIAFCIAIFFFMLLFWPETVRNRLKRAGITEVAGVRFDTEQVEMAVRKTGEAQQQVAEVKQNVEATKQELDKLHTEASDPQVQKKLEAISAKLDNSLQTVQSAEQGLRASRQTQETILQQAASVATPALNGAWGVVVSGDKQTEPAIYEVKLAGEIAKETGFKSVALYDRQGWLRTVVEFASNTQAQAALPTIRQQKNQRYEGAYVVNLDDWCPNRQQQQTTPVTLYKCP